MPNVDRIKGITIEIGADNRDFVKSVRDIDKEINKTQGALKDINKLLKFSPESTELLSQKQKNLKDAIEATKNRLEQLKSVSKDSLSPEQYDALQREIVATEADLKRMEDEYKKLGDTGTSKLAAVGDAMKKIGAGVVEAGKAITEHLIIPIAKAGAEAITAGAGAIASLTKSATEAFAQYEQLEGGVQTLFGAGGKSLEEYAESVGKSVDDVADEYSRLTSAEDTVLANAQEAWRTTGLSANEYMSTVTSFSASLISSLGGDTQKAAALADQAMVQMADNANKMGTDISSVQAAYQGFAKGQFTLLDNLKLGYGGTKTEMQRLLKDAEKIQKAQGKNTKYSINNFADIVEAIKVVQDEMGITGTTAAEAEKTIEGSLNATKAAWQNVLVAFAGGGTDIKSAIDDLVNSGINVIKNILPVVKSVMQNLGGAVKQIAPIISENLGPLLEDILPVLIDSVASIVSAVANALPEILPVLGKAFLQIVDILKGIDWLGVGRQLWAWIASAFSAIGAWASEKFGELVTAIKAIKWAEVGTAIWGWIKSAFANVGEWATLKFVEISSAIKGISWADVGNAIWGWIQGAFANVATWFTDTFGAGATAIFVDVPWATEAGKIWDAIKDAFSGVVDFYKTLFISVKDAITGEISWSEAGTAIWNSLISAWSGILEFFITLFASVKNVIISINWAQAGTIIWGKITTALASIATWFGDRFREAKDAIYSIEWTKVGSTVWGWIKGAIAFAVDRPVKFFKDTFNNAVEAVKKIGWTDLGTTIWDWIKEPFASVETWFSDTFKGAVNAVIRLINKMTAKVRSGINSVIDGINSALTINIPAIDGPFGIHWDGFKWSPNISHVSLWDDIKELAKGGTLREGGRAIVGEYAPEYLRVVNGRAIVTPIEDGSRGWRMGGGEQNITINIYQQPGQNAQELASAVQRVLVQQQRQRAVAYA